MQFPRHLTPSIEVVVFSGYPWVPLFRLVKRNPKAVTVFGCPRVLPHAQVFSGQLEEAVT